MYPAYKSPLPFFLLAHLSPLLVLFASTIQCITPTQTQITTTALPQYSPTSVINPAYARTVNKLYVAGGTASIDSKFYPLTQAMALDLAVPWNSTSPAWIKLSDGPMQTANPAVFSRDEQTMYTFQVLKTNSPWMYNVQNNSWQELAAIKFESAVYLGISAVTDLNTGLIYLTGGYELANANSLYMKYLDIVDPITQKFHTVDLPDPLKFFPHRRYYGSVWSEHRKSIIYWGGKNDHMLSPEPPGNDVTELVTETMAWSTLQIAQEAAGVALKPEGRNSHCMAANEDGTKVVIYGGTLSNQSTVGELWILDLITLTWSQGLAGPTRELAACTVAGDYFLVWAGSKGQSQVASSEMVIYDLKISSYVKQYTPPAYYKNLQPLPPLTRTKAPWDTDGATNGNGDLNQSSVPIGAVVGGVVGGLVLIGFVSALFLYRQRQRRDQPQDYQESKPTGATKGLIGLLGQGRGLGRRGGRFGKGPQNDSQDIKENEDELERTFEELEEEQRKLDQKKQQLVLQQRESNPELPKDQKRGPTAFMDDKAEFLPPPTPPPQQSPDTVYSVSYSAIDLNDRRTVQGVTGPVDMYHGDSYSDAGPRRVSELAQETIEPLYRPSPSVSDSIPDLVYVPPPNVGMAWTKQQSGNHPHAIVDSSYADTQQ